MEKRAPPRNPPPGLGSSDPNRGLISGRGPGGRLDLDLGMTLPVDFLADRVGAGVPGEEARALVAQDGLARGGLVDRGRAGAGDRAVAGGVVAVAVDPVVGPVRGRDHRVDQVAPDGDRADRAGAGGAFGAAEGRVVVVAGLDLAVGQVADDVDLADRAARRDERLRDRLARPVDVRRWSRFEPRLDLARVLRRLQELPIRADDELADRPFGDDLDAFLAEGGVAVGRGGGAVVDRFVLSPVGLPSPSRT